MGAAAAFMMGCGTVYALVRRHRTRSGQAIPLLNCGCQVIAELSMTEVIDPALDT
jgi:hypothetical protein